MNRYNYLLLTALLAILGVQSNAQQFYFSSERPGSCAATDGIITIVPTRGVPPFTYQWSTGATEVSIKNLAKGDYSATLTDATGATVSHTHILNSEEFDLYLSHSQPSGFCNPNSGALTVDPEGGVAPYVYTWSNGQTSATNQGLVAGTYSVTVQDATGCVAKGEYTVNALTFQYYTEARIAVNDKPDCANPANGALDAAMYYSNYPPYSYAWSTGATTQTVSGLSEGTYSVTITDALGCTAETSTYLNKKLTMTGSVVCTGNNVGTADALLVNATAPVTYLWSNGQTGTSLSNLANGTYVVTATDANGCSATEPVIVAVPSLYFYDNTPKCYSGNNGGAYCTVFYDQGNSFLWDDGVTAPWNQTMSPGVHSVTVTTNLGCTLSSTVTIPPPVAPPITFNYNITPSDCTNGTGGAMNLTLSGGIQPLVFNAYGPDGFYTPSIASLQNLQSGTYYLSAQSLNVNGCNSHTTVDVPDASGFSPALEVTKLDCNTGFGAAAVLNVTSPGAQYDWSNGATASAVFNLTEGCYSVTVSAGGLCTRYFEFCMQNEDSLQIGPCVALASGQLVNDLGIAGCAGTTGIPYQLIRTMPSGALNFTDENGMYTVSLPGSTFDLEPASYDPVDIACPPSGKYTVNAVAGANVSGLDFHFLNSNPTDHRIRQKALRTAQPGYPYSLRMEVCNDGMNSNPGVVDLEFGNIFGSIGASAFAQHPGAFTLTGEIPGSPNNEASLNFPGVAPGACELYQIDWQTPVNTPLNTAFITSGTVSPASGDPTPDNNVSTLYNTVVGAFDPNSVLSYPARNGNPKDGGEILLYEDKTIVYQIFFQNTGNAPADLVVVRDRLDESLDISSIRNITASHGMRVLTEEDNKVLVFKFENINLPDSTSDYAGSIGSIQYEIDRKPGLPLGTEIEKQVAILFDFNSPVLTNNNVLEIVSANKTNLLSGDDSVVIFPNPADAEFGFYCDSTSKVRLYNPLGVLVATQEVESGLQRISTASLPAGIYLLQLDTKGKIRNGKVVVSH